VLSLGTGQHTVGYDAREVAKWGLKDWLANKGEAPLVDMVFNANADMVDYNLSIMFQSQKCPSNYLRIQVPPGCLGTECGEKAQPLQFLTVGSFAFI